MTITMPTIFINRYIIDKFGEDGTTMQFYPTSPTAIDDFTEQFPEGNSFYVYDRMMKIRRNPFPHIKDEQMLMYFYSRGSSQYMNGTETVIESAQKIADLLDRGDESADEVNSWIRSQLDPTDGLFKLGSGAMAKSFKPVYFHSFKVFQLEETADIIDFGTARTWAGNKLIVDYKYHIPKDYNSH